MSSEKLVGGWEIINQEGCNLPQEVATAFSKVVEHMAGAKYVPALYCAKQLVSGTNHMLICEQTLVTNPATKHIVKTVLYIPLDGPPTFTSIETII